MKPTPRTSGTPGRVPAPRVTASAWDTVSYEVRMRKNLSQTPVLLPTLTNALTESRVLHARQQCDVFLSKGREKDDIKLEHLVPDWQSAANCAQLRELINDLKQKYGSRKNDDSPCWVFNVIMAHPTLYRGHGYNYGPALQMVEPVLAKIVEEIESVAGRNFNRDF